METKHAEAEVIWIMNDDGSESFFELRNTEVSVRDSIHVTVEKAGSRHPWISHNRGWQHIEHLSIEFPGALLNGERDHNILLAQGEEIDITINPAHWRIEAKPVSCSSWLRMIPGGPKFEPEAVTGTMGFEFQVKPKPKIKFRKTCKINCKHPTIAKLKKEFTYTAYDPKGEPFLRTTGRRVKGWIPLRGVPPHAIKAFLVFEDPGFERHKGVLNLALLESLKINLKKGRFVRGGSTITMQLAKNLFLGRQKTIGRKVHEIILAGMLEGCFTKSELLELYVNIVEYGPNIYGIGPAARHYFKKEPMELEPVEAFYLARILPRPNRATPPDKGGLERVERLMRRLVKQEVIPAYFVTGEDPPDILDEEFAEEEREDD
jgi:hypothetical protein